MKEDISKIRKDSASYDAKLNHVKVQSEKHAAIAADCVEKINGIENSVDYKS